MSEFDLTERVREGMAVLRSLRDEIEVLREANKLVNQAKHEITKERDHLQAFKTWVHNYLDNKGIPANPGGPHIAEGCRIGDRMDYVFEKIALLTNLQRVRDELCPFQTEEDAKKCDEDYRLLGVYHVSNGKRIDPLKVVIIGPDSPAPRVLQPSLIRGGPTCEGVWFVHRYGHWHKVFVLHGPNWSECDMAYGPIVDDTFKKRPTTDCILVAPLLEPEKSQAEDQPKGEAMCERGGNHGLCKTHSTCEMVTKMLDDEKRRRIYYQGIAYYVSRQLELMLNCPIVCGSANKPSSDVQDAMQGIAKQLAATVDMADNVDRAMAALGWTSLSVREALLRAFGGLT